MAPIDAAPTLEVSPLVINAARYQASWSGRPLVLMPKEFDLLLCLARESGVVLSRETLLARVWHGDYPVDTRTVDVHLRWLREKIETQPSTPVHLLTVRGLTYRFAV